MLRILLMAAAADGGNTKAEPTPEQLMQRIKDLESMNATLTGANDGKDKQIKAILKERDGLGAKLETANKEIEEHDKLLTEQSNQLQKLAEENAELKAAKAQEDADEKLIAEKTAIGLTREQAQAVIKRQRDYDAAKAAKAKAVAPATPKTKTK